MIEYCILSQYTPLVSHDFFESFFIQEIDLYCVDLLYFVLFCFVSLNVLYCTAPYCKINALHGNLMYCTVRAV